MYCLAYVAVDKRERLRGRAEGRPSESQRGADDGREDGEGGEAQAGAIQRARMGQDVVQAGGGGRLGGAVKVEEDLGERERVRAHARQSGAGGLCEGLGCARGHRGEEDSHGRAEAGEAGVRVGRRGGKGEGGGVGRVRTLLL